jgi:hypothetical protein
MKSPIELIKDSNSITGHHILFNSPLHIDYVNKSPEDDDIVMSGNNCTIFTDDLKDSITQNNTILIKNRYAIHIK